MPRQLLLTAVSDPATIFFFFYNQSERYLCCSGVNFSTSNDKHWTPKIAKNGQNSIITSQRGSDVKCDCQLSFCFGYVSADCISCQKKKYFCHLYFLHKNFICSKYFLSKWTVAVLKLIVVCQNAPNLSLAMF